MTNLGDETALTYADQLPEPEPDEAGVAFALALIRLMRSAVLSGRAAGTGSSGSEALRPKTCLMNQLVNGKNDVE